MRKLGIELISVFGLPPIPFVELAAQLNCQSISVVLEPLDFNPENYPGYSLRSDTALRRELRAALAANHVQIGLGEGFIVRPPGVSDDPFVPGDDNMRDRWAADLEVMATLGIPIVNAVCMDHNLPRAFDQLGLFAELAASNDMVATIEFCPGLGIADLATALQAVEHVGDNLRLLLDPMHLIRSGGTVADLATVAPSLIAYAQVCDVLLEPTNSDYLYEAMNSRLAPGEGDLPLFDYVAALPEKITVSLEVPQRLRAVAGEGPHVRMASVVAAAHALLARVEGRG